MVPSHDSKEEAHKARILFYAGLIISLTSLPILITQIIQTILPGIPPAPWIDFGSDILALSAGVMTLFLLHHNRPRAATYLVLASIFLIAIALLYYGPHPQSNVGGLFALLLFSTLAMVLLDARQAWFAFAGLTIALLGVNYLRMDDRYAASLIRDPESQVLFSFITWVIGGGIITLIIFTTKNVLRNQALRLNEQLKTLREQDSQLKASEKRYQSIFEGVQDSVLVQNGQGDILDVNQKACQTFGYNYPEFLKIKVEDIVTEEGLIVSPEMLKSNDGFLENLESINRRADGETFPVEMSAQLTEIAGDEVMVFVLRDITKRKSDEAAIKRQLNELAALHRVAEVGTQHEKEDPIIEVALTSIAAILQPDFHGILFLTPDQKQLNFHPASPNVPPDFQGKPIPVGVGIIGEVASSGEAQYYPDVSTVPHYLEIVPDTRSELCVPIKSQKHILGVINIESNQTDAFTSGDQRFLQTLAGQLGTSMERTRLFNTVKRQLSRLQSLRTIDRAISGSLDINVSMNIILNQITDQLKVDAACVLLLNQETTTLQYIEGKGFTSRAIQDMYQRLGSGLAGNVAAQDTAIHVPDLRQAQETFLRSFLLDQERFIFYYGLPLTSKGKPQGVIELFHRSAKEISGEWIHFAETLAGQAAIALDHALMFDELQRTNLDLTQAYDSTLEGWAKALELRDHDTEGHSQRVTSLTLQLSAKLNVPEKKLAHIRRGALLHDIGKMAIPDKILQKQGALSPEEWEIIKKHPLYAQEMLQSIQYLEEALEIPLYHHERWDGTGYPEGLAGQQIPLPARIFAVVDVWDALTSNRPYRTAWDEAQALAYLKEQSGKHFDPEIVQAFLEVLNYEE